MAADNSNAAEGFAGLPGKGTATTPKRASWKYVLPRRVVSRTWSRDEGDLAFHLIEMTPDEQDRAVKASGGGQNVSAAGHQMIVRSISRIGEKACMNNHDFVERWLKDIGPKGYRLVQAAWVELHSVEDDDVETFLEAAEYVD